MKKERPNLPNIGSNVDANVRRAFDVIRSWFDDLFDQGYGITTRQDLVDAKVINADGSSNIAAANTSTPPKVLGIVAVGSRPVVLTWTASVFSGLSHYEVYRGTTDNFSDATVRGSTHVPVFIDMPSPLSGAVTYRYWIRGVSHNQISSPWSEAKQVPLAKDEDYMKSTFSFVTYDDELAALATTVSGHTTSISSLNTTVSGHTSSISSLNTTVSGHTTSISNLNTTVSGHTTDITDIKARLTAHGI